MTLASPSRTLDTGLDAREASWSVVFACFCVAVFAWGFGFYGQAVYLAELQRLHGWPAALLASGTTAYYLFSACLLPLVPSAIDRLGPRSVFLSGVGLLGAGVYGLTAVTAPWQIYVANAVMAAGWSLTSGTAITTTIALWFDRRRGLAISLALNGASVGGFTVAPALVYLTHRQGVGPAALEVIAAVLLILVPAVSFGLRRPPALATRAAQAATDTISVRDTRTTLTTRRDALRSLRFWSVAVPFALAITAQVGVIVHQVAYLLPTLGPDGTGIAVGSTAVAAVVGRLALGTVIDRLDVRGVSAISFAAQAAALSAMIGFGSYPAVLYAGSIVFGLSVGNVITLPALVVQREFAAASFGLVIGLSFAVGQFAFGFGPALLGLARDLAGGYGPALGIGIALELVAAVVILRGRPRDRLTAPSSP